MKWVVTDVMIAFRNPNEALMNQNDLVRTASPTENPLAAVWGVGAAPGGTACAVGELAVFLRTRAHHRREGQPDGNDDDAQHARRHPPVRPFDQGVDEAHQQRPHAHARSRDAERDAPPPVEPTGDRGKGRRDEPHPIAHRDEQDPEDEDERQRVGEAEQDEAHAAEHDAEEHDGARPVLVHEVALERAQRRAFQGGERRDQRNLGARRGELRFQR